MAGISVGDVVFVRFPFSDLSHVKLRPALVLALIERNDLVLCQITSKSYSDKYAIQLLHDSFLNGHLKKVSYIRPEKLFTANLSIINKTVASIKPEIRALVVQEITHLLNQS